MTSTGEGRLEQEGRSTSALQDTKDLVTGNVLDLGDTRRISEGHTNLRGRETLPGHLRAVLGDLSGSDLQPRRGCAAVGQRRGGDALAARTECLITQMHKYRSDERCARVTIKRTPDGGQYPGVCIRPMVEDGD